MGKMMCCFLQIISVAIKETPFSDKFGHLSLEGYFEGCPEVRPSLAFFFFFPEKYTECEISKDFHDRSSKMRYFRNQRSCLLLRSYGLNHLSVRTIRRSM